VEAAAKGAVHVVVGGTAGIHYLSTTGLKWVQCGCTHT